MKLILTPFDYEDLLAGHSFNTLTQSGQEIDVHPADFSPSQIADLASNLPTTVVINGQNLRVSRDLPLTDILTS